MTTSGSPDSISTDDRNPAGRAVSSRAAALCAQAQSHLASDPRAALAAAGEALLIAQAASDTTGELHGRLLIAQAHAALGQHPLAAVHYEAALPLCRRLGRPDLLADCLVGLGAASRHEGRYGAAMERLLEALRIVADRQDRPRQVHALLHVAQVHAQLQQHDEVLRFATEALELADELRMEQPASRAAYERAAGLHHLGRNTEALAAYDDALRRVGSVGPESLRCALQAGIAVCQLQLGDIESAMLTARQTVVTSEAVGNRESLCSALLSLATAQELMGAADEAHGMLEFVLSLSQETGSRRAQAQTHGQLARLLERAGNHREALRHVRRQLDLERQLTAELLERRAQVVAAQLEVERLRHHAEMARLASTRLQQANDALQAAQVELRHRAERDPLTGLANRAAFEAHLARTVDRPGDEPPGMFAVVFMDLDGFKPVNDTYGHAAGDELLRLVARRLERQVRGTDLLARIGGDEFVVVTSALRGASDARRIAAKLRRVVETPFEVLGHTVHLGVSVGAGLFPQDGASIEQVVKHADSAMYRDKQQRRQARLASGDLTVS